ncbi:MAG: CehA/McbA family metallohydrolase [Anaerolineae bacterium]
MHEYTANFHQHTLHSDGAGTHKEVISAGNQAGLDVMVFTDHNLYLPGLEGWANNTLALMGIEVNDTTQIPEHSHYLCLGVDRDLNDHAADPQALINAVNDCGGAGFIAHPFERAAPLFGEGEIPWKHWQVSGYTGLEIWNYMSEFKSFLSSKARAVHAAFYPDRYITAPFPETLAQWDNLMWQGQKVVAIGGSDAHANTYSLGPLSRTVFPYRDLFRAVRTHLLLSEPLSRQVATAKQQVLNALRRGHCFVAYDHIGDTTGFRFTATNTDGQLIFAAGAGVTTDEAIQGDELSLGGLKLLQLNVTTPLRAEIRLLKDGQIIAQRRGQTLSHLASEPGVYRVECYRVFKTRWRGWIYSNPIYVRG